MSESLIDRSTELAIVVNQITELEADGLEIPTALVERLETALTSQAEKVDACAAFVSRAKSEIDWLKAEEELLASKRKRIERGIERMKELAKLVMQKEGVRELTGLRGHKFSIRDSYSVAVVDEDKVPGEFTRIVQRVEVNKAEALKTLKTGVEIVGLALQKNENVIVK